MTSSDRPGIRVLIGASSYVDAAAAIRIIQGLPLPFRAHLGGVMIEDEQMLATFRLPDKRIVMASGATMLAPDPSQLRILLEADARAFRTSLARAAESIGVPWTFARKTGDLINLSLRAAADWDILVIGHRRIHKMPGKIIRLQGSSPPSETMLEASRRLSNLLAAEQVVFSVQSKEADTPETDRQEAKTFSTLSEALKTLGRTNAQAVFVDLMKGPVFTSQDLSQLLDMCRCSVFVFGAPGTQNMQVTPTTTKQEQQGT